MARFHRALCWVSLIAALLVGLAGCGKSSAPKPVVLMDTIREKRSFSPVGVVTSSSVGVTVVNEGGSGEVFVRAAIQGTKTAHTLVFRMDKGERAVVWARFGPGAGVRVVKWSARAARRGDKSSGNLAVERSD